MKKECDYTEIDYATMERYLYAKCIHSKTNPDCILNQCQGCAYYTPVAKHQQKCDEITQKSGDLDINLDINEGQKGQES